MKKLLSLLLVLALCLSLFPAAALAEEPVGAGAPVGPSDDADEPVGAGAPVGPEETTPPSSQGDDTSPYTGEAEIDPEEPVGAGAPDGPADDPEEPVGADALDGPSDDPDALPEEPVADDLQAATASGECGDNLTWTLENNVLTISGTGDMWNGAPWNGNSGSVRTVVIQPGVTSIGNDAFSSCSSLTSVTIPEGVTSIGRYAFEGCSSLTSVTIPSTVTSMERAFFGCSGLTEILVAEGSQSYASIDGVLYDASGKTLLQCPGGKSGSFVIPEGVTSIGNYAFYECSSLTSVEIPAGVTSIGAYAFNGCNSLTDVYYGGTMAAWNQLGMPYDRATVSIHCADGDITADPSRCGENLIWSLDENGTLTISGSGDMWNWGYPYYAPWSDSSGSVKTVVIQPGVTSIGSYAFYKCSRLTSVTIPAGVTSIRNYAFYECSSLTSVTIPEGVTSIGNYAFSDCSSLTSVTIPAGVTSIGNGAFSDCSSLTSVTIPASVTSIGNGAFDPCSSLTDVYYGGTMAAWKQLGVTYDRATVSIHCTDGDITADPSRCGDNLIWSLDENGTLTIAGSGDMWDWSYNSGAPWNNNSGSVRTVVIQPGVTSIGDYAFYNCSSLTSVTIPEGVTSIGIGAFSCCSSLTSVTIPASVTSIGNGAFDYCSSLTVIDFSGTRADWKLLDVKYDHYTVSVHCSDGEVPAKDPVYCGDELIWTLNDDGVLTISGNGDMWNWTYGATPWIDRTNEIKNVCIMPGVTSIGDHAFMYCNKLTSVSIPGSVVNFGTRPFFPCTSLMHLSYGDTREAWERLDVFYDYYNITVHCTDGDIAPALRSRCGRDLSWALDENRTLTISGTGDMWDFIIAESGWFAPWDGESIKAVNIRPGVTSIGDNAFCYCDSLAEIRFSGNAPVFGYDVFYGVTATAYYPANDPTWTAELRQSYGGSITWVPYVADSAEVASGTCGANGDNLTWILYENGTLLIRGSGAMAEYHRQYYSSSNAPWYAYRDRITNLILPEGLTSIGGGAFYQCKYISRLELPSTVKSIRYEAFYECSGIRGQLILPEGLTSIGEYAFGHCSGLTGQLILPEGLTSIPDSAFYGCSSLTSVEIPESVTRIGNQAFDQCIGVRSITLPSSVTSIGQDALNVGNWNTEPKVYIDDLDWWLGLADTNGTDLPHGDLYLNGELVTEIAVPAGTLTLRPGMFRNMRSLERVTIPESVTSIGNSAFSNCSSLSSITIPEGLTSIGDYAFEYCSSLTSITIPSSVTGIGYAAFSGCSSLTSVTIPAGVTGIGDSAFSKCYDLARIDFLGDVPSFGGDYIFRGVTATALYPLENETWTADKRQNYGGAITWTPYRSEPADTPIAYAVAFDPNGGEAGPSLQYKGRGVDLSLTEAAPTRDYYTFSGWATDPAAAEPDYLPGAPYAADADVTLYAVWTPRTWTLQYLPSGGTGVPEEQVKTYGQPLTLSETVPEREGYEFLGWSPFYWDNTPRYFPGDSFDENGAADNADPIKLYAVWQIQMYLISYKPNGGDEAPASQLKTYGRPITLSEEIPTRSGYTFLGWATNRKASEPEYQPGDRFTGNADTVLYAVWEKEAPAFDPDALTLTLSEIQARPGETFTVTLKLTNNPGIKGVSAEVIYDESVMTLVSATPKISGGTWNVDSIAEDHLIYWYDTDAFTGTDVVELSFRVADSAEEGEYAIGLQFDDWDSVVGPDNNEIESFNIVPGTLTVTHRVPGDINGDGKVSLTDVVLLARYVKARGRGVEIVPGSGDVNGDGTVNIADVTLLAKYVKARGQGVVIH